MMRSPCHRAAGRSRRLAQRQLSFYIALKRSGRFSPVLRIPGRPKRSSGLIADRRLLGQRAARRLPLIPPAEAEEQNYAAADNIDMAA